MDSDGKHGFYFTADSSFQLGALQAKKNCILFTLLWIVFPPWLTSHHSLVACDLFGVSVEEGDFDSQSVCWNLLPGPVGEDDKAIATGQNLLYLEWKETTSNPQAVYKPHF